MLFYEVYTILSVSDPATLCLHIQHAHWKQTSISPVIHSVQFDTWPAGDVNEISIGEYSNVQDGAIVHVAKNNAAGASLPTKIGNYVTIGIFVSMLSSLL